MLGNHLSQEHDWASRTTAVIERQVAFIHQALPENARILDLGCGPGLYTERFAALGHSCVGVDFSPASIAYARRQPGAEPIEYVLGDIRRFRPAERFDAVLLLFGELNAFSRPDAAEILHTAARALRAGGRAFVEVHSHDAVRDIGHMPAVWHTAESGLFSEKPHLYLEEHFWNEERAVAMTRYFIVDAASGDVSEYSALMQAYSERQYDELLAGAGFGRTEAVSDADWPTGTAFAGKLHCFLCGA